MKIVKRSLLALGMGSILITQTGCFGTFALTRKAYEFHDGLTDSKFLKSLLFWIPGGLVYGIVGMLDVVIFNLIEFWSGSNPIAMKEGEHEMQLVTVNGERFKMEATKDTFTTTQLSGEKTGEVRVMKFDRCDNTWKYSDSTVSDIAVMTFVGGDAENIRVYTQHGTLDLTSSELTDMAAVKSKLTNCDMALAN